MNVHVHQAGDEVLAGKVADLGSLGGEVLSDIRRDLDGIESVSRRLGPDDCRNGFLGNMLSACLRLVAPLC